MGCTIAITLLKQFMQVYDFTPVESIDYFCSLLPDIFNEACETVKGVLDVALFELLNSTNNADVICHTLRLCYQDEGQPYCHLFAEPPEGMAKAIRLATAELSVKPKDDPIICEIDGIRDLCEYLDLIDRDKTAKYDSDGDYYSSVANLRGYDWRGKDCSDENGNAYPGRLPDNSDIDYDSNCNGIYGVNPDSGIPYEDELCGDFTNYGIIMIGDSIGAHFHIPPDWVRADVVSADLLKNLTFIAGNELDWPQMSFSTGFINGTWPVVVNSTTNSLYWRMRDRNLCIHRDYQNLAFNGARSATAHEGSVNMTRDDGKDRPAILVYAEFGNDICRSDTGSVDEMTPVDEFTSEVLEYLDYLDTRLPQNSHVILVGLINGTYLYTLMHGHLHPLGELNQDIDYDAWYNWYSCLQIVCPAWTNTNRTEQDLATEHAMELSAALKQIAETADYNRFDVHYLDTPIDEAIALWTGDPSDLIEHVDGLHPSKYAQDLFAQVLWEHIVDEFPEILDPINPNNDKIREIFGDQGGN